MENNIPEDLTPEVMPYFPAPWFPAEYAGTWTLQDKPGYELGSDLLDADDTPYAQANAYLAAAAPDMIAALQEALNVLYDAKRGQDRNLDTFVELAIKAFRKARVKPEIFEK